MNANTLTATDKRIEAGREVSRFGVTLTAALAAVIGLWGTACLVSGLAAGGPAALVKGLLTSITGM